MKSLSLRQPDWRRGGVLFLFVLEVQVEESASWEVAHAAARYMKAVTAQVTTEPLATAVCNIKSW